MQLLVQAFGTEPAFRVTAAEAVYSPDGQWISFLVPSGTLVLTPASGVGGRIHLSSGGAQLRWRSDMKELYYIAPDRKLMAVPLTTRDGVIEPGSPRMLFQTRIVQPRLVLFQYDVTPSGDRFLINSLPGEDAAAPLTMIVNWTEAVR